jgi:hypothetical protein
MTVRPLSVSPSAHPSAGALAGSCRFGAQCMFAHAREEIRAPGSPMPALPAVEVSGFTSNRLWGISPLRIREIPVYRKD